MSQVTNPSTHREIFNPLLRYADSITVGELDAEGRVKELSVGKEEPIESIREGLESSQERPSSRSVLEKRIEGLELICKENASNMRRMERRIQELESFAKRLLSSMSLMGGKKETEKTYILTQPICDSHGIGLPHNFVLNRMQSGAKEGNGRTEICLRASRECSASATLPSLTTRSCTQFLFKNKYITQICTVTLNRNELLFVDWEAAFHSSRREIFKEVSDICGRVVGDIIPRTTQLELFSSDPSLSIDSKCIRAQEKDYKVREIISVSNEITDLEGHLYDLALDCMQDLARDCAMREKITPDTLRLLNSGVFYGNRYLEILLDLKNKTLSEKQARAINAQLKTFTDNGFFFHGLAPAKYFKFVKDPRSPTGKACTQYLIKEGISPSDALDAVVIRKELIFLDCTGSCYISYYVALRKVLGKDKFDFLFASDGPTPLLIGVESHNTPIKYLSEHLSYSKNDCVKGMLIHFQGPSFYKFKHMNGEGQNWSTFLLDPLNEKYIGLGLNPKGVTFEDIEMTFVEEYNADPIGVKGMTLKAGTKLKETHNLGSLVLAETLKEHRITLDRLRQDADVRPKTIIRLDIGKIYLLVQATKEKGREFMASWKEKYTKSQKHS